MEQEGEIDFQRSKRDGTGGTAWGKYETQEGGNFRYGLWNDETVNTGEHLALLGVLIDRVVAGGPAL